MWLFQPRGQTRARPNELASYKDTSKQHGVRVKLLQGAGWMLLRGVGYHYECVKRNLVPMPRLGQEGPRPFAPHVWR